MADHTFCRLLLKQVMVDVRKVTTAKDRKGCWAWCDTGDYGEFHGPNGFYWHGGAHCKWEARAKGWMAWLDANGHTNEEGEVA